MGLVKTSITIPDEIFNQAKNISKNFSALVVEALNDYLKKEKIRKAMSSFGKWEERDKSSIEIVNKLRKEESREYAKRDN